MLTTLMIFHAIVSLLLILIVLLQFGKGAETGLFSGAGSDAIMSSSQKGNILVKITVVLAVLFLGNSLLMAKIQSSSRGKSLLDSEAPVAAPFTTGNEQAAPAEAKPEPAPTSTENKKTETK